MMKPKRNFVFPINYHNERCTLDILFIFAYYAYLSYHFWYFINFPYKIPDKILFGIDRAMCFLSFSFFWWGELLWIIVKDYIWVVLYISTNIISDSFVTGLE